MDYSKHSNAVHRIRTNMNFLKVHTLAGGVERYKIGYFMVWLFFQQVVIFLAVRKQFDNQEDWNKFVSTKISIIRQVINEFIACSIAPEIDKYLDKMLPVAEEIFNLNSDDSHIDLNLILEDAIKNRNDYLKLTSSEFVECLTGDKFEVQGVYTETKALHQLQIQPAGKTIVMQFELQSHVTPSIIEEISSSSIYNIVQGDKHPILFLVVGSAM